MGNAPSPVITKAQVKAHLKYVWAQQKLKFRLRKVKVRGKVEAEAYRLWQRFPYRVVNKNVMCRSMTDPGYPLKTCTFPL
jgi:hypothetical protein